MDKFSEFFNLKHDKPINHDLEIFIKNITEFLINEINSEKDDKINYNYNYYYFKLLNKIKYK